MNNAAYAVGYNNVFPAISVGYAQNADYTVSIGRLDSLAEDKWGISLGKNAYAEGGSTSIATVYRHTR